MRTVFLLEILLILIVASCAPKKEDLGPDTGYLPEGVEVSKHKRFVPDGQNFQGQRTEPPFWWTDMADPETQVMIYDQDIGRDSITLDYRGVEVIRVSRVENPNYVFLQLRISKSTPPGTLYFNRLLNGVLTKTYPWELKRRVVIPGKIDPLDASDVTYLIMPDRFANGDTTNDSYPNMRQTGVDRNKMYYRHGGDLAGIIAKLDYLEELGVSALWLNPILENDQPYASYHGYAITDFYTVDPRYGSNSLYARLSQECQARGIKLIKDIVINHCGDHHWFVQDIPDKDWIHQFSQFTRTNHAKATLSDPYAAAYDQRLMTMGWFDHSMPDLNQAHPLLAKYLIQNVLWWIEFAGLDGFRIDTYPYVVNGFFQKMINAVRRHYPGFPLIGETWVSEPAILAQFEKAPVDSLGMPGEHASMKDFPLCFAIHRALTEPVQWDGGVHDLYTTLAQDFLYPDPNLHLTFLDNHDMSRFFSVVGENFNAWKSGVALLMTLRGIPSFYYGTELLMTGKAEPDGLVRQDFPGGWPGDTLNKFYPEGRSARENEAFAYFQTLAKYRKHQIALSKGDLVQFAPEGNSGTYAFLRSGFGRKVLVLLNTNDEEKSIALWPYREEIGEVSEVRDVINNRVFPMEERFLVPGETTLIFELKG